MKALDDFAKNLATGISRRKAFFTFLGGAGALGFLGLRKAKAGIPILPLPPFPKNTALCGSVCLNWAGEVYDLCMLFGAKKFSVCFSDVMGPAYDECTFCCTHQSFCGGQPPVAV